MWLHAGLTLSSSGTISGSATESGTYGPVFEVKDSRGTTATKQILLLIYLSVTFNPAPLADAVVEHNYSETVQVWGGLGPYTLSITSSSDPVPVGLNVAMTGTGGYVNFRVFGAPMSPGSARLQFQVRDEGKSRTVTGTYPLRILSPLTITPATLPAAGVGFPYSVNLSVSGGIPPYTWGTANGIPSPPAGLTFDAAGVLSGTPTTTGNFVTFLQVKDSGSPPQTAYPGGLWIVDRLTVTKPNLKGGVVDKTYAGDNMEAAGGQPPFTWTTLPQQSANANLPPGITLAADGTLSGLPTATGTYFPVVEVRDSSSPQRVATGTPFIGINPHLAIYSGALIDGIEKLNYWQELSVNGGMFPYTMRVSSGSLPPGLILNPAAFNPFYTNPRITGSPDTTGAFSFTLEATDSSSPPDVSSRQFMIRVNFQLVFNPPASLPDGLEGAPYSFTFTATGGLPPYSWDLYSYVPGLSMNPTTGTLSGVPGGTTIAPAGIRVSDSSVPPQQFTRYIPFKIIEHLRTSTALPPLRVGAAAHLQLGTSGGTSPFRWTFVSGSLPSGLIFTSSTGEITGTPTAIESQTFTVRLDDSGTSFPQFVQQTLTLNTVATQGRNDSVATATPLSNGTYYASISPGDDGFGNLTPDSDYFSITANPGAVVGVVIRAELLSPPSPMDSVLEIVNSNGQRLIGCDFVRNAISFTSFCLSDDDYNRNTIDSALYYRVPGTPGSASPPVTVYVHVLDWSGMARPDFLYTITITGAN